MMSLFLCDQIVFFFVVILKFEPKIPDLLLFKLISRLLLSILKNGFTIKRYLLRLAQNQINGGRRPACFENQHLKSCKKYTQSLSNSYW